jgi:hypothetical protein
VNPLLSIVKQMQPVDMPVCSLASAELDPANWKCGATRLEDPEEETPRKVGATVWVSTIPRLRVAVAWEWVEVSAGVLVVADPNNVISNLRLIRPMMGMESMSPSTQRVVLLNAIVRALPWQSEISVSTRASLSDAHVTRYSNITRWPPNS